MLKEVIDFLKIKKSGKYIDATLGGGGYTKEISSLLSDDGRVLSIDLDPLAIDNFSKHKSVKNIIVNDNFANLKKIVTSNFKSGDKFDGIVADLGLSSAQLEDENRGFSFKNEESIDMSFGPQIEGSSRWILNNYNREELEGIIKEYGEESWAKKIANNIFNYRRKNKIDNSKQLAEIVATSIPPKFWSKKINPATKTFQAIRMETNREIDSLKIFLSQSCELLNEGGRLIVVSFHSLEDRTVKLFFKEKFREDKSKFRIITKKPITPSDAEVSSNRRSRSAKLRVLEKVK